VSCLKFCHKFNWFPFNHDNYVALFHKALCVSVQQCIPVFYVFSFPPVPYATGPYQCLMYHMLVQVLKITLQALPFASESTFFSLSVSLWPSIHISCTLIMVFVLGMCNFRCWSDEGKWLYSSVLTPFLFVFNDVIIQEILQLQPLLNFK